ncbi:hypothetical protein BGZ63DRAFT_414396 [Mariannaea sp. PMI_226]|nr:hypothetical protein BGZ63DRAFT_414396 [Mariannaea sp. PMI_226]
MQPIITCVVAGLQYLIHPQKIGSIQEAINPDAILPVTLLTTDEIFGDVDTILELFDDYDDIFTSDFGFALVEKPNRAKSNVSQATSLEVDTLRRQIYHLESIVGLGDSLAELPSGPYFLHGPNLHQAWRLYSDDLKAFALGVIPEDLNEADEFQALTSLAPRGDSKSIAVPSRLYHPRPSPQKPLSGIRISLSDLISLKGAFSSLSSRAWSSLYSSSSTSTSNLAQGLIELGAIIVGKSKTSPLGTGDEWVDEQSPWSPRGDGYQTIRGSSVGTAASVVGYEWLHGSIGSDDNGVSAEHGVYSITLPPSSLSNGEVGSASGSTNAWHRLERMRVFSRSLQDLLHLTSATLSLDSSRGSFPQRIIYPSDFDPSFGGGNNSSMADVITALENFLDLQVDMVTLEDIWNETAPGGARNYSMQEYMKDYQEKFQKKPFVETMPQFLWDVGVSISRAEHEDHLNRLIVYRNWFDKHVMHLYTTPNTEAVMILPCGMSTSRYRDEPPAPPTISKGITPDNIASILGVPHLSAPFTQTPYESRISGKTEYKPICVSIIGSQDWFLSKMAEPTNTPVPASTPRANSPVPPVPLFSHPSSPLFAAKIAMASSKLRVLHIGDPIKYNPETYARFSAQFDVVRPPAEERQRPEFIQALKEKRWGDFHAIFRPFWGTGGEMGQWDAELIDLLPETVRVFASAGAGFDWADTKLLGQRGIIYCNSGLAASDAVADFSIAMIISTFRQLPWCMNSATSNDHADFQACHKDVTAQAHNLRGQRVGFIGFGNIGQQIAARCHHGFGMDIHYYDVIPKPASITEPLKASAHDSLQSLLGNTDCVILCTPAGNGALINEDSLKLFRRGSRFVNIARGSLVDEDALATAIQDGQISTAALDVHANEPSVHPGLLDLARNGRVMLTCHNAGGTAETHIGFEELSMRNIMAVLTGGDAITPVNLHHLKR